MAGNSEYAPLSQVGLYPALREFYATSGAQAWAGTVPLHATSNPNLADCYATVILRFVQGALATGRVDGDQPFYVAELGAGTGKFGFHFVQRLRELRRVLGLEHLRIIHVMSDVTDANIAFWCHHPRLRPFVERGELLFARFDAETDGAFRLISGDDSERQIGELAAFANPLTVVANYVFDALPQDLFRVVDGELQALWATMAEGDEPGEVRLNCSPRPVAFPNYADPELDRLLAESTLEPGSKPQSKAVLFPVVALTALRRLADAASGRLCLLVSDLGKGARTLGRGTPADPELQVKTDGGFFYLPVDLSAIGRFFAGLGPGGHQHLVTDQLDSSLSISGFDANEVREARHAFASSIAVAGARGRLARARLFERCSSMDPEEWLAVADMVRYDSRFLDESVDLFPRWVEQGLVHSRLRQQLFVALRAVGAEIYWTPGAPDSYFNLASALLELGDIEAGLASYVRSIETCGAAAPTYVNMALGLRALDRRADAIEALRDALALDPTHVVARGWLGRIQMEVAGELPALPSAPKTPPE